MRMTCKMLLIPALAIGLMSCNSGLEETKKAALSTSEAVNSEFVAIRKAEETMTAAVLDLYAKYDTLDLSTKGMDASEGGLYATFPGYKYYYKKEPKGSGLYASPGKPIDEPLRKQVKFLEYVDPFLQKAASVSDIVTVAFYGVRDPITIALMSPWYDLVSLLPPGLDLNMFEWYQRGLKSSGAPVWSPQPFTDLNTGWVMDVAAPVNSGGQNKGVSVISVNLAKLAAKYFTNEKQALLLMGPDTTVVGLSPQAEKILKISALQSVDYLKQVKENTFAAGVYHLVDTSKPASIQELGRNLLAGKPEFEVDLEGKKYMVVQQPVVENGMVVVGLSPR